jgi:hypothetical protein
MLVVLQRFQRTYEALEQEGNSEKQQISAVHQQRIEVDLNNKKRVAMKHYMDELSRSEVEVGVSLHFECCLYSMKLTGASSSEDVETLHQE